MHELWWVEVIFNAAIFVSLLAPCDIPATRAAFMDAIPSQAGLDSDSEPHDPARLAELDLQLGAFTLWTTVAYEINRTGRTFVPGGSVQHPLTTMFFAVPLSSMGTREEHKAEQLARWENFSGPVFELVDVEGERYTMLSKENSASFADKMREVMHRTEDLTFRWARCYSSGSTSETDSLRFALGVLPAICVFQ
ncbi:hypothetical protein DFH09DRAFT_1307708 [Mycena vulgaris]|nr:hypothetical protein DFH09DRAFT_1307708 [Mycena vulgaris]